MTDRADLLVHNCGMLCTLAGPERPRRAEEMRELATISDAAVAVRNDKVIETGDSKNLCEKYADAAQKVDARRGLVLPGFVDCHTHLIYAGSRANELAMRIKGATYLDILAAGGGIHATVQATRRATHEQLARLAIHRLDAMLRHGTTTAEIKSGYGLELESERKMLEVARLLDQRHPVDVVATFLGAHVVPEGTDRRVYVDRLINEALPALRDLAKFCDVFCERQAFTLEEAERILVAAASHGYALAIHAGQFTDLGAAGMAAGLGACSASHLEHVSGEQLAKMAEAGTVAVLLPGVPFFLLSEEYPDAREMIDAGVSVALATDLNPGSCPSPSMQMMISLACLKMAMTAEEAVVAATVNAAWAVRQGHRVGSLEPGKQADLIVLDVPTPEYIPYHFGANLVRCAIKAGRVV